MDLSLLDVIRVAARTGDFRPVFDYLAEDVEFSIAIELRLPTRTEIRGRQSVIRHLQSLDAMEPPMQEEPVDVFSAGERIVACRNASVAIQTGMSIDSECTLVFDVCNGLIARLAIQHELFTALEGRPTAVPLVRKRDGSAARSSVIKEP
jgi:hypothetical protein